MGQGAGGSASKARDERDAEGEVRAAAALRIGQIVWRIGGLLGCGVVSDRRAGTAVKRTQEPALGHPDKLENARQRLAR